MLWDVTACRLFATHHGGDCAVRQDTKSRPAPAVWATTSESTVMCWEFWKETAGLMVVKFPKSKPLAAGSTKLSCSKANPRKVTYCKFEATSTCAICGTMTVSVLGF